MKTKISHLAILILSASTLSAMQFQTIGYKSVSMGGAGVASSSSSTAAYNNPALLGKSAHTVEVSIGLGASAYDHGAGASYQALNDNGFQDLMDDADKNLDNLSQDSVNTLFDSRDIILDMDGKGFQVSPQGYIGAQVNEYGFGIFTTSETVAIARVSQKHDQLIFEDDLIGYQKLLEDGSTVASSKTEYDSSSLEAGIDNGDTYFDEVAIVLAEVPIAYSYTFESSQGNIYFGGALKYMQGITYKDKILLSDEDEDNSDDAKDKISSNFGIDLGLAYEPSFAKNLTLALVMKNLNSPSFSTVINKDITIDPMIRMGIAYNIIDEVELAMDIDVISNETLIPDLESQMIGGGINYMPVNWFSIRAGLMTNLNSNDKADIVYTAGMGLGPKWFQLDLSAQISSEHNTISVDENNYPYPQYAKINLALVSRW